MSKEVAISQDNLDGVLNQEGVTVVRFTANWCGPCRMIAPIFEELANDESINAKFVKVDVDEFKETPTKFGVRSIPYIVFLDKDSNVLTDFLGAGSKQSYIDKINEAQSKLS